MQAAVAGRDDTVSIAPPTRKMSIKITESAFQAEPLESYGGAEGGTCSQPSCLALMHLSDMESIRCSQPILLRMYYFVLLSFNQACIYSTRNQPAARNPLILLSCIHSNDTESTHPLLATPGIS